MKTVLNALAVILIPALALGQQSGNGPSLDRTIKIDSRVLREQRVVEISLPRGYETSSDRYPVIVVLDGESEHDIATSIARFYASTAMMPPAIVVGVRNTNRTRDMTPPAVTGFTVPPELAETGGAKKFLTFIGDELLPYVDRHFRTVPMRVLVGHSLGGLLALHSMSLRPAMFTGYVVMEPAIWWNNEREFNDAHSALGRADSRRVRLMLVNAPSLHLDTTQWGGTGPMIRDVSVTGETHESMAAAGMLFAFRTMFADFRPSEWKPGTHPIAMLERYDSLAERVGYPVPIPISAYEQAARMSIDAREFDDADRILTRMKTSLRDTSQLAGLRGQLREARATPAPAGLIPLVIPARRPTPKEAQAFLGRWKRVGDGEQHEISVQPSGDTIIVRDRIVFPNGGLDEGEHQVIQVTSDGALEWGLPWFRGLAALLVLKAQIQPDGTMRVAREPRGWVPRGPAADMYRTDVFQRVGNE